MKQRLSLLDVCKIPDVQLHSKQALFKALINRQSEAALDMKDQIIKLSYTVKTVGVQGGEVGISSKRVPLKLKKKQDYPAPTYVPDKDYIPHRSFYAQALIPIKKEREKLEPQQTLGLHVLTTRSPIIINDDPAYSTQQFKIRTKSMVQLRTSSKSLNRNKDQSLEEFGKIKGLKRVSSAIKKKSFSNMLKECKGIGEDEHINPLLHQQNPLFRKIKRIKSVYPEICRQERSVGRYQRPRTKFSSSQNLLKYYRQQL